MSINLNHIPNHSPYTHQISWGLQKPLALCVRTVLLSLVPFPPQTTRAAKVKEVFTRIIKVLLSIVFFTPALLLAGFGRLAGLLSSTPSISRQALHLAPNPISLELKPHRLSQLTLWFDELNLTENRDRFLEMIQKIENHDIELQSKWSLPDSFFDQMSLYLTNVIDKLTATPEQKQEVLTELAHAARVCPATWFEVAKNQLLHLTPHETEQQILQWVMEYKEQLILLTGRAAGHEWHFLSYVREHAGAALGLLTEGTEFDRSNIRAGGDYSERFITLLFGWTYRTDRLLPFLLTKINQTYRVDFFEFLKTAMQNRGMTQEEATDYVYNHFYRVEEEKVDMNLNGAIMILRTLGLIT